LKKMIFKICEKIAFKIVSDEEGVIKIDTDNIEEYIGHPHFHSNRYYLKDIPPGVVMGLAYHEYGGSILYIEATRASFGSEGKGNFKVTGSLGDVMKESTSIA
jgi:Lon-like ATP-dependent protease